MRTIRRAWIVLVAALAGCGGGTQSVPMTDEQIQAHEKARADSERRSRAAEKTAPMDN
jgi:hypothetical protein